MTSPKPLGQFQQNFTGMFIGWSFLKIAKIIELHAELWLPWQLIGKTLKEIELRCAIKAIMALLFTLGV